MRRSILDIIQSSPESRQSRNLLRFNRDTAVVNNKSYGSSSLNLTFGARPQGLPGSQRFLASATLSDGKVLFTNRTGQQYCFVYDVDKNVCTPVIPNPLTQDYSLDRGVLLPSGKVYIAPALTLDNSNTARGRVYDPATNTITPVGPTFNTESYNYCTLMPNGKIFLSPYNIYPPLIVDPNDWSVETLTDLYFPFGSVFCLTLPNGKIFIPKFGEQSAFVYDCWTKQATTIYCPCKYAQGGTVLSGDKIFINGSSPSETTRGFWILDVNTLESIFINTGTVYYRRYATLFPDGNILATNGFGFTLVDIKAGTVFTDSSSGQTLGFCPLFDGRLIGWYRTVANSDVTSQIVIIGDKSAKNLPKSRVLSTLYKH